MPGKKNTPYRFFLRFLAVAVMAFHAISSHASIVLYGTRIVFPADQREVTLKIVNVGDKPALAQAWLDDGSELNAQRAAEVPFVVAPSLTRMESEAQQTLRIVYTGQPLPADRESLFWLNVLDIPPKDESQAPADTSGQLALAFRTRIKLMYRPKDLPGKSEDAPEKLQWSMGADASGKPVLQARNATPYVVNLGYVELKAQDKSFTVETGHVLPGETTSFAFSEPPDANAPPLPEKWPAGMAVVYTSLDDWGGTHEHQAGLAP